MKLSEMQSARLSKDPRFDGLFFIAVKTTGIYCRPICPAVSPKEENVIYVSTAIEAANLGCRPCLRCRPDSAPGSNPWKGTNTTFERAIKLINNGELIDHSIVQLSERLGISSRYLNSLFQARLGISAKKYALYQQALFAKSLLQQSHLAVSEVAFACGFASVRRFNDYFAQNLKTTPSKIRKNKADKSQCIQLFLSYRPPYNWPHCRDFLQVRAIESMEWLTEHSYGRAFTWPCANGALCTGWFDARHQPEKHGFIVNIQLSDSKQLLPVVKNIRRLLDLDANSQQIDQQLKASGKLDTVIPGLRLPGIWNLFEAGCRAILGQQISVVAALKLVRTLVHGYGSSLDNKIFFPTPKQVANSDLLLLKMPNSRRETLLRFARFMMEHRDEQHPDTWLSLKGIGPWTVNYAKMRGLSDSNIWLGSDLGIKKALAAQQIELQPSNSSPWQSYLTLHIWNLL